MRIAESQDRRMAGVEIPQSCHSALLQFVLPESVLPDDRQAALMIPVLPAIRLTSVVARFDRDVARCAEPARQLGSRHARLRRGSEAVADDGRRGALVTRP